MKKSLLALAALTAFAGAASAQSSVTLFGIVDVNARNVKNGAAGDINSLSTDGNASSRLGFRGVEDLGGGLRAGFWLEAGLDASAGTVGGGNGGATANTASGTSAASPGAFFNRRATVSLLGGFGEIRLGRDYVPTFWNHTVFDVFGTNGVASASNIVSPSSGAVLGAAQTFVRANNSIGYFLPSLGGLYGQVMVAATENQPNGNGYVGGRIGYGAGPINVAASYGVTKKSTAMLDDMKAWNVGASYNAGFLTAVGQYSKYEEGAKDLQNWSLGVAVPVGAGTVKASYGETTYTKATATAVSPESKATQIGVGYVYDLSKRTALYAHYAVIDNEAGQNFTIGGGLTPPNGAFKSTGYEFGVRHSF